MAAMLFFLVEDSSEKLKTPRKQKVHNWDLWKHPHVNFIFEYGVIFEIECLQENFDFHQTYCILIMKDVKEVS